MTERKKKKERRREEEESGKSVLCVSELEGTYKCVLHHRGHFRRFHHLEYDRLQESWYLDPDFLSYFQVLGGLKEMGYIGIDSLRYHDPKDVNMLVNLRDDLGTKRMKNIVTMFDKVHLYVVHSKSNLIIEEYPSLEYFKLGPNEVVINGQNRLRFGFRINKDCNAAWVVLLIDYYFSHPMAFSHAL
ncbi:hypothetical protein MTR_4g129380 [Medicago truncatula]|uniref:PB1-like domain-containing protein n=1 Tax=Medicago truncatula TaxID=3880 RepID=G7JEB2_MEDTR|nr:hypothetical protein MTR_4g129380 [Medicago truncatula]